MIKCGFAAASISRGTGTNIIPFRSHDRPPSATLQTDRYKRKSLAQGGAKNREVKQSFQLERVASIGHQLTRCDVLFTGRMRVNTVFVKHIYDYEIQTNITVKTRSCVRQIEICHQIHHFVRVDTIVEAGAPSNAK